METGMGLPEEASASKAKAASAVMVASSEKVKEEEEVIRACEEEVIEAMEAAALADSRLSDALLWLECGKPLKADPASRASCKVCMIVRKICLEAKEGSLPWSPTACKICVVQAAALERIKVAGGSIDKVGQTKPIFRLKASSLAERNVIKTALMEGRNGKLVKVATLRLPYDQIKSTLQRRPRKPLAPLSEDFFEGRPDLRESVLIGAAAILDSIQTEENILFQYFKEGHASVEVEVIED